MRRLIPAAAVLALLALPAAAWAQTAPATTPSTTTTAPMKPPATKRMTLQQRFDAANTSHDGHLTKDQAAAANWSFVASNYAGIDKDKKGFVTVQDIRAFAKARRAARMQKPAPTQGQPATPGNG